MGEEVYGVDPLGLTIPGAVDFLVLEAFIDKTSVACDASGGVPAVDVALLWVHGVRK